MTKRLLPALLLLAILLTGCRRAAPLVGLWQGTWYDEEMKGSVTLCYRFTEDGQLLAEGDGFSLPFGRYAVKGDTLTLTGDDDSRSEFTFSVKGDRLTLYYVSGAVYAEFHRIKDE